MSEAAPVQPLVLNIQYTKDLSFEVPNAPAIYQFDAVEMAQPVADPEARRARFAVDEYPRRYLRRHGPDLCPPLACLLASAIPPC